MKEEIQYVSSANRVIHVNYILSYLLIVVYCRVCKFILMKKKKNKYKIFNFSRYYLSLI
jgi:hypothetical protein